MDIPESINDLQKLKFKNRKRIWKPFMEKYGCQVVCELGVREGENFELMIEHTPKEAVAVDSWIEDGVLSRNDIGLTPETLETQCHSFADRMASKPFVKIYREYTFDAVRYFPDEHFDLVYIDADHTYESCLRDIKEWFPKVKKGGFLLGDDYIHGIAPGGRGVVFKVIEAVNDFAKENNLKIFELPLWGWSIIKPYNDHLFDSMAVKYSY